MSYEIRRNGIVVGTVGGLGALVGGAVVQPTDQFAVTAKDAAGNVSPPATAAVTPLSNPGADGDSDGVPDQVEELLGTNKTAPGTAQGDTLQLRIQKPHP